jgi:Chaperone of endosialidase
LAEFLETQGLDPGEGAAPESFFPSLRLAVHFVERRTIFFIAKPSGIFYDWFMKTTTLPLRNSMNRSPLRAFLLMPLVLACFALSPQARAVCREGCDIALTNTFLGDDALVSNTLGISNTAVGWQALESNTSGAYNTAIGSEALEANTLGEHNTAVGLLAFALNTSGSGNTAIGNATLLFSSTGSSNTAIGSAALEDLRTGDLNTAVGAAAMARTTTGSGNTAIDGLIFLEIGNDNIAVGRDAGNLLTHGDNNIYIGNPGAAGGESGKIRIGKVGTQNATFIAGISGTTVGGGVGVIINSNGKLGTIVSSERFKDTIKPMDKASEAILALQPVTFRYKHELDPDGIPQFGLAAEEVEKVNPALVARDEQGKPYTVRYEAVNAMLLNEFLKEHKKVEQLEATVAKLAAAVEKVSAQAELGRRAHQTVVNNQ